MGGIAERFLLVSSPNYGQEVRNGKPAAGDDAFRFHLRRSGDLGLAQRTSAGVVTRKRGQENRETSSRNLLASMRLLFSSPYLRAIATVICIGSLVTTLTDWQFLALGQQFLVKKDVMAVFFGNFNFYAGVLGLCFNYF